MRRYVYCLFDKVAEKYLPVFEASNLNDATRMLKNTFFEQKNTGMLLEDYQLVTLCMAEQIEDGIGVSLKVFVEEDVYELTKLLGVKEK